VNKLKLAWIALLTVLFISFSVWYGGNGKPLTAEEGAALLQQLRETHGVTDGESSDFMKNMEAMIPKDDGKEFYAVNLETHKQGEAARASDAAYGKIVFPQLLKRGGHPVFLSEPAGLMLGEFGNGIDRVAVVRYRSLRDMIDMASDPSMKEGEAYKFGALEHTEVFITRPTITFMHVRFVLALILALLGLLGLKLIDLVTSHRSKRPSK